MGLILIYTGYGVFTCKFFDKGSFLLEYPGDLMSEEDGLVKEEGYAKSKKGCYLYFFEDGREKLW